jgi:hypothetical protein
MKTTYPNGHTAETWQMQSNKQLSQWHKHIHTARDNEKLLPYATLERQILALKIKLKTCSVKQFFPLQNKIKQLEKQLAERKNGEGWDNYLAL